MKSVMSPKKADVADVRRREAKAPHDVVVELLGRQLASGLWDDGGHAADDMARVNATAAVLRRLRDAGVTTAHALHGAQLKKAVAALLAIADASLTRHRRLAELATCSAWLAAAGRRTRADVERRLVALGLDPGATNTLEALAGG